MKATLSAMLHGCQMSVERASSVGENSRKLRRRRREKQDTNEWNGLFFVVVHIYRKEMRTEPNNMREKKIILWKRYKIVIKIIIKKSLGTM